MIIHLSGDTLRSICLLCFSAVLLCASFDGALSDTTPPSDAAFTRSVVDPGDTGRLGRVFARANAGQPIVVLFVGGSITEGAKATIPANRYVNRVGEWWKARFPKSQVTVVNAGIGATGSDYGCFRFQRDIAGKNPDVVFVDFAVNDSQSATSQATYEGIIRQLLSLPKQPAVVSLFMMHQSGSNNQKAESEIGKYYGLPMLSYRDAIWPEIQSGIAKYEDYQADQVHPNDNGHAYVAALVAHYLDSVTASANASSIITPLPAPLHSDLYQYASLYEARSIQPAKSDGWTLSSENGGFWTTSQPGSVFECVVEGQSVSVVTWRIKGAMGRASARVDDQPAKIIDGWFDQTWGGYRPITLLADGLAPGKHTVHVELLDQKDEGSTGYEFRILAIGTAGVAH
ncbi:MAG: GDSL-type esterase/lipase family protein [Capsulimonadaceae bacterium]|nr:GDSL-type esterase/lipase family protein [Capsulimonadaceae bacterium]